MFAVYYFFCLKLIIWFFWSFCLTLGFLLLLITTNCDKCSMHSNVQSCTFSLFLAFFVLKNLFNTHLWISLSFCLSFSLFSSSFLVLSLLYFLFISVALQRPLAPKMCNNSFLCWDGSKKNGSVLHTKCAEFLVFCFYVCHCTLWYFALCNLYFLTLLFIFLQSGYQRH